MFPAARTPHTMNPDPPTHLTPEHRKLWRGALAVLDKCRVEEDPEKLWAASAVALASEITERKTDSIPVKD